MLNEKTARKEAESLLKELIKYLKLEGWKVKLTVASGSLEGDMGHAIVGYEYRVAHIKIDPDAHETMDDLRKTVAHELLHVVLSPIHAAVDIVESALDKGDPVSRIMVESFRQAEERIISHLEETGYPLGKE